MWRKTICLLVCFGVVMGMLAGCGGKDEDSSSVSVPLPSLPVPSSAASSEASSEAPSNILQEPGSLPVSVSVSSETPAQPAPQFIDNTPAVGLNGATVTVTYKTNVESTVNTILSSSGSSVTVAAFYNYYNRGQALEGAAAKQRVSRVTSAGGSASYEIPDLGKTWYVLSNAAENETGTWQNSVTVTKVYDPAAVAPAFKGAGINRVGDVGDNLAFTAETTVPCTVYCLITAGPSGPTAQQIRDGGSGHDGTVLGVGSAATNADQSPYTALIQVGKANMATATYYAYFVAQSGGGVLSEVGWVQFTLT